ncbi:hypothetical protein [Ruegeria sp.]|uniref:hypothetical protein n=1 Tax=Ruegeria sp. TaxID=1879320 RepID=UPI00231F4054|nr:hypothetical protein [Ruegeria sp.]MDA7966896.1 hypothetical protein [Ruegeria sp.]
MTKLFMQFHRFEKKFESSVNWNTGNWRPLTAQLNGYGSFVYDIGQDVWDHTQEPMKADGTAFLEVFFSDDVRNRQSELRFRSNGGHFCLTPLGEDGFEYSLSLPTSHIPWFLEMLKDCKAESKILTSVAVTEDETKVFTSYKSKREVSEGRFLMRPYERRIQAEEELETSNSDMSEADSNG